MHCSMILSGVGPKGVLTSLAMTYQHSIHNLNNLNFFYLLQLSCSMRFIVCLLTKAKKGLCIFDVPLFMTKIKCSTTANVW